MRSGIVLSIQFAVLLVVATLARSSLISDYWDNQRRFRPCAVILESGEPDIGTQGISTVLPTGYTFFRTNNDNGNGSLPTNSDSQSWRSFTTKSIETECNLSLCQLGLLDSDCKQLGIDQITAISANTSIYCSCNVTIPNVDVDFDRGHTGVVFSPYTKNWPSDPNGSPPKWNSYTMEDIKVMLGIISKQFSQISTYGMGAIDGSTSWRGGDSSGLVPAAAAELNKELKGLGLAPLSIMQGLWHGTAQYQDIFNREVTNAFEAAEYANGVFPGTVTGLIFTSDYVSDMSTAQYVSGILDKHKERAGKSELRIGIRLNTCHRVIVRELPETNHQLHGVPPNYTYSEFGSPSAASAYMKPILERVDFVICAYEPPSSLVNQKMVNIIESLGNDFMSIRKAFHGMNHNVSVIAQTGWPSWGISSSASPNNVSNLVQFWAQMNEWAVGSNYELQLFEAFDEPWKNDLSELGDSSPKGPAGSEGFYGWWRRYETNGTVTFIPKFRDLDLLQSPRDSPMSNGTIFIAMSVVGVFTLGIMLALCWRLRVSKLNIVTRSTEELAKEFRNGTCVKKEQVELGSAESEDTNVVALRFPYNRKYELSKGKFSFDTSCVLGQGNSGIVYKGRIAGLMDPVAFKTLKSEASLLDLKNLLSEIKIMSYVGRHDNIVNLLGANTAKIEQGEVYVAAELCEFGSLESYLKAQRGSYSNVKSSAPAKPASNYMVAVTNYMVASYEPEAMSYFVPRQSVTFTDLLRWAFEIASGLEHISLKRVIHADVACRNVLISTDRRAKITDFGLSRQLYYKSHYLKSNTGEKLPWRWMAVESLRSGTFSITTDVWSFGVTLWEIFSLAQLPYPGVMEWGEQFLLKLEQENYRMLPPAHSTPYINDLMQRCWSQDPSERPTFTELKEKLGQLYQNSQTSSEE